MIVYDDIFQESKIDAKKRDSLKDSDFGIPDKREYPLIDKEHVRKAVQMFSYADESDRHELAERIVLKAKKFGMNWDNWLGIRRYLPDSYKQYIQESVRVESSTSEQPFYFYHLLPKTVKFDECGLKTPDYVYTKEHDEELYLKMTNKYRNRLCNEWGIYPDKNPDDLTAAEIYAGINEFRQDIRGNNQIYLFRYPPTESLGHNMKDILKDKCIVRVDINDPKTKKYIHDIFWGHEGSFTGNKKLSREWYENISKGEYFKDYDDDSKMIFASSNHISLDPEYGYLPIEVLNISESATDGSDIGIVDIENPIDKKSITFDNALNTCKELYKRWSQFKYGIPVDGHVKNVASVEYYDQHYRFLSPKEFVKYGGGICWDFVEYGRKFLLKKRIKFKTFYISTNTKHNDTHTIIVCESNGKLIYPESSFKLVADDMDGVGIFDAYDGLFKYIANWMFEINDNKKYLSKFNYYVWEYKDHPPYGCNSNEFTSFVTKGEPDFEGVVKYKNEKEGNNMQNDFYDLPEDPINIMEMDINDDIDSKTDDLPSKELDSMIDDENKDSDDNDSNDDDDSDKTYDEDDLDSFGSDNDGSTPNNEYDENEIKILNDLIADEQQAMSGYFDGALNTKINILARLYAEIGNEERFHAEQLMYAKSTITGEQYSPQDPKVKSEYEDLLKMGMDEETAMSTAIDKRSMIEDDDGDDSEMEDIEDGVSVIESSILQNELLMSICEYGTTTMNERDEAFNTFVESYIYMEEMDNVSSSLGKAQKATNPLKLLMKGFRALLKILSQLSRKIRDYINKSKIRRKRKMDWIKKHGIKEVFAGGVSLYFYSDKTASFDVEDAIRYVDMLYRTTKMIASNTGMRLKEPAIHKTVRNPIQFKTVADALNIMSGIVLTKTKVVLTEHSEPAILEELFGYKDNKLSVGTKRGDDAPVIHESGNFYNRMEYLISATTEYADIAAAVLEMLERFEGDTNSIYYKNRSVYNNAFKVMQEVCKSYNTIINAMTHDLNTVMKLDNGILAMSRERDRVEQTGGQWDGPISNVNTQQSTNNNKYVEPKRV